MPSFSEKPTAAGISSLRQHLLDTWSQTHSEWEKRDEYYFQTFGLWPTGLVRPTYHPGRSRQIVDAAVDHQLASDPLIHRFPAGEGEAHERKADVTEQYLGAVFAEAALMETALTWKAAGKHLLHLGYAVVEGPMLDMRERPKRPPIRQGESSDDYEERLVLWENEKKTWMPFRIRAPHPSLVLLDPEEKRPRFGIKHALRYSHDLHDITSKRKGHRRDVTVWEVGDNPFALIMSDEYWTKEWHSLMVGDGEILFIERNPWGFVPFGHAFCGWGLQPTNIDENDPVHLAAGILTPIMESLKLQAQAVSGRHNALMEATFNTRGTRMDAAELQGQLAKGDIVQTGDKGDYWWSEIPQLPAWMFEAEQWIDHDIELATMSRTLGGGKDIGVSTVGQHAMQMAAASRKFIAANKQMEHLATVVAGNILRLVDVLGETLYCRGYTIRPSDIEHDYSVQVTFEVVDPVLQLQERELGMREHQAGLVSKDTYWSAYSRLEDASGERKRLLRDLVRSHPAVVEAQALEVAKEMGVAALLERWQAAQTAAAAGNGTGNGQEPSGLLGPDGMPILGGSLGRSPIEGEGRSLRQPLTPAIAKPARVNPLAFGA